MVWLFVLGGFGEARDLVRKRPAALSLQVGEGENCTSQLLSLPRNICLFLKCQGNMKCQGDHILFYNASVSFVSFPCSERA